MIVNMHQIKERYRYVWVVFFLMVTVSYNNTATFVKKETPRAAQENGSFTEPRAAVIPTLYTKQPESLYGGIMQSQKGDVFRVAFEARGGNNPELELLVHSSLFYESVKVGEVEVESTEENEYKEVVFVAPGSYDSIIIRLKGSEHDETSWNSRFAFIEAFSLTKLDIDPGKIAQLSPTVIGFRGLPQSRLEDFGSEMLYTFSTSGDVTDYQSVFDASQSTYFDGKKKAVVAAKRKSEYFVYKLDMMHLLKKLIIKAEQHGSDEDEIHLQYSFDGSSWETIQYVQKAGGSQQFFLSLDFEVPQEKLVFIKVSYEGEDKKTGTFALEELKVNALVVK